MMSRTPKYSSWRQHSESWRRSLLLGITGLLLWSACALVGKPTPTPLPPVTFGESFVLGFGHTAQLPESGDRLTFTDVRQDSRCPSNVECAAHGPVVIELTFKPAAGEPLLLTMNPEPELAALGSPESQLEIGRLQLTLLSVDPYPAVPEDLGRFERYLATLLIEVVAP
jgi:hypothetical protein